MRNRILWFLVIIVLVGFVGAYHLVCQDVSPKPKVALLSYDYIKLEDVGPPGSTKVNIDVLNGCLQLVHENAYLNGCLDSIMVVWEYDEEEHILRIYEDELFVESQKCKHQCYYRISMLFEFFEPGEYYVELHTYGKMVWEGELVIDQ